MTPLPRPIHPDAMYGSIKRIPLPEYPRDIDFSDTQLDPEEAQLLMDAQCAQRDKADKARYWQANGRIEGKVRV